MELEAETVNRTMVDLTAREKSVLAAIVEDYVLRKEPIGSRTLSKDFHLNVSPATIRNTMMDLEEKGFLSQPHTSAGRIPTDAGYRLYVQELMDPKPLSRREIAAIKKRLMSKEMSIESILSQAAQVVGLISHQLGIILAPSFEEGVFESLQMVRIHSDRVMLVLSIRSRLVKTVVMEIESDLDDEELHQTTLILNQRLHGLSVSEIRKSIRDRMANVSQGNPKLISLIMDQAEILFRFDEQNTSLQYGGTSNLLEQPEFLDTTRLKSIFELLEERNHLAHMLKAVEQAENDVTIIIGHENKEERLQTCSIIAAHYSIGNVDGVLSVIGPTRMSYARLISVVQQTTKILNDVLQLKHN